MFGTVTLMFVIVGVIFACQNLEMPMAKALLAIGIVWVIILLVEVAKKTGEKK